MTSAWWPVIWSLAGGGVLAGAGALMLYGLKGAKRRGFKRVFGPVDGRTGIFHIIYASLDLKPAYDRQGELVRWPYTKKAEDEQEGYPEFQIDKAVSSYETRAAGYIASSVGLVQGFNPLVLSDAEVHTRYDLSFVSLGGPWSNYKSRQALNNPANQLVTFGVNRQTGDFDRLVAASSGKVLAQSTADQDFGLIVRIRPRQFPERVWLVCAGLGERGTSGAAWYLANRWPDLLEKNNGSDRDFAAIIRVDKDSDESAVVFAFFNEPAQVKAWPKFKNSARSRAKAPAPESNPVLAEPRAEASEIQKPEPAPTPALEQIVSPEPETVPIPAPVEEARAQEMAPLPIPGEEQLNYRVEEQERPPVQTQTPAAAAEVDQAGEPAQPWWPEGGMPQRSVMAQLSRADEPVSAESRAASAEPQMSRRPVEVDPRPVDSHYPMPMIDTPPAQSVDYTPRNNRIQGEEEEDSAPQRTKEVSYV